MSIMEKAINYVSKHQEFWVVMFITFSKLIAFHYICFDYLAFSSIMDKPLEFFAFYFAKLAPAIFIASFVFIVKKRWWTIVVSFIIDLWLIANIVYFRVNDCFLDFSTITMAGNMDGFWLSVIPFFSMDLCLFPVITILYGFYVLFHRKITETRFLYFIYGQIGVVLLVVFDFYLGYGKDNDKGWHCNMYQGALNIASGVCAEDNVQRKSWVENGTVLRYFPAEILCRIATRYYHKTDDAITFSDKEEQFLKDYLKYDCVHEVRTTTNLVVILVESLESWTLLSEDVNGDKVAPNLISLLQKDHLLFSSKIRSQAQRGSSGDGQMIVNTGLLPIKKGAACMLFGENIYPNLAHFFNGYVIKLPQEHGIKMLYQTVTGMHKQLCQMVVGLLLMML